MHHILTMGADAAIKRLEMAAHGDYAPGTMLVRVVLDASRATALGLRHRPPSLGFAMMAWRLVIRRRHESTKLEYYGWTIIDTFVAAWKDLVK